MPEWIRRLRYRVYRVRAWIHSSYSPKVRRYYETAVKKHGDSLSALGWKSHYSQFARFEALFSQWHLAPGDAVLDVGCGFGDLVDFLSENAIPVNYLGIDLSPAMIAQAKKNHPGFQFEVGDLFGNIPYSADYVVASGAFSLHTRDPYFYLESAVNKMVAMAQKGVALNMLSSQTPTQDRGDEYFFYFEPSKVVEIATRYSARWTLLHHYLPNDFTLILFK